MCCEENGKDEGEGSKSGGGWRWSEKRPWYDVWCGGIVLHASSPLASPPSVRCEYGGMCRLRTAGRKRVLTAGSKHSPPICLFVCALLCEEAEARRLQTASASSGRRKTATPGHITTHNCGPKSIFPSISYWIVPLARVQEWTSAH